MDNLKRYNQNKEDEMQSRHSDEKRRLPKIMKAEGKTRALMFKQSLRMSTIGNLEDEKHKIKMVSCVHLPAQHGCQIWAQSGLKLCSI